MAQEQVDILVQGLTIRTYHNGDRDAVQRLFTNGLLKGQVAPNDTGADIDHIDAAYFDDDRHHFWVAQLHDKVVGMIGVASDEEHTAEIRRLRIDPEHQNSDIAAALLATALDHCKHHAYIKIVLDTRFDTDAAVGLFDKIGFQHTRTRPIQGKELLEFYLDLYRQDHEEH